MVIRDEGMGVEAEHGWDHTAHSSARTRSETRRHVGADYRNLSPAALVEHAIRRGEGQLARLTHDQALCWFLSGYTSTLAGTEREVNSPEATFSACFGAPFLPLPPQRYVELLGERLDDSRCTVWLVNTDWSGGPYGAGERMPIALTRAVVAATLDGSQAKAVTDTDPVFGFAVPHIPAATLRRREGRHVPDRFDAAARRLARDLAANSVQFERDVPARVRDAGPVVTQGNYDRQTLTGANERRDDQEHAPFNSLDSL